MARAIGACGLCLPGDESFSTLCLPWEPSLPSPDFGKRFAYSLSVSRSRHEIEDELCQAVESAQARLKRANRIFAEYIGDIPSGLPTSDGALRIRLAGEEKIAALRDLNHAVKVLHLLIVHGKLPDSDN